MDDNGRNRPGALFVVMLLLIMAGTVWVSSYQTFKAWSKPDQTKEEYQRSLVMQQEKTKALTEQNKADMKALTGLLIRDARTELIKKDYDKALKIVNDVLQADPENAGAYLVRGIAYYLKGKWTDALTDLSKVISLDPNNAEAFVYRGLVRYRQNDHEAAGNDFTRALTLNSQYGIAHYYRGMIREQAGQEALAQEDFKKAYELKVPQAGEKIK